MKKIILPPPFKDTKSLDADCTHEPVEKRDIRDIDFETNLIAAQYGADHDKNLKSKFDKSTETTEKVLVKYTTFSAAEIINTKSDEPPMLNHYAVLSDMYKKTAEIDFNKIIDVSGKKTDNMYQIAIVDQILKIAKSDSFRLCQNNQSIYVFNGVYWKKNDSDTFSKFLGISAVKMGLSRWIADGHYFRDGLMKQFNASAYLPKPEPDKNKILINLQNGTFEFNKGEHTLRSFDEKDFLTHQLPFSYDKKATSPIFKKYLDRVLPDIDSQNVISEYLGYLFIKHGSGVLKAEKVLLLYGSGHNGKSVLHDIIYGLLGGYENVSSYSLESLTDNSGSYRAMIDDKILNYATEISSKLNADIFKTLVSGEPISARHLYKDPMILTQYAKMIFNCNNLPKDSEQTHAFFRRLLIVPFNQHITIEERKDNLAAVIIETELSGVFNWILSGLERLLKNGKFSECAAADQCLETYKHESDNVSLFLTEENWQKSTSIYTLVSDIYSRYLAYCMSSGCRPLSKINFNNRVKNLGVHQKRGANGKQMLGLTNLYGDIIDKPTEPK